MPFSKLTVYNYCIKLQKPGLSVKKGKDTGTEQRDQL